MGHQYLRQVAKEVSNKSSSVTATKTSEHSLLQLQSVGGNSAVNRLLRSGSVNRGSARTPIQTKSLFSGLSGELANELQPKPQPFQFSTEGGKPLPTALRQEMETAFSTDFSDVRIHAGEATTQLNAEAFTAGNHIAMPSGKANFDTPATRELLGHELAHVVQQRAGRVPLPAQPGLPINTDPRLEAEADAMGARVASGEAVSMPGGNPGMGGSTIQAPPVQLKKKFKDSDLDPNVPVRNAIAGGAINQVDLVTYNQPIGNSTRTGFFKADLKKQKTGRNQYIEYDIGNAARAIGIDNKDPQLANRAVATSRIAALLKDQFGRGPGNVIAETAFASHKRNGRTVEGTVSEQASGRALKAGVNVRVTDQNLINNLSGPNASDYMYDLAGKQKYRQGDPTKKLHVTQKQNPNGPDEYEDPNAFYEIDQYDYYHQFNFQDPEIQKGLSNLQILDAITGQVDRHGANIFIDANGKVTGIDNDAAFGKDISDPNKLVPSGIPFDPMQASHNKGLPSLVDYTTAKMVLDLDPNTVKKELKSLLSSEEIQATIDRLNVVKQHIRNLYATGCIVRGSAYAVGNTQIQQIAQWDANTYNILMQAGPNTSYLAHAATRYAQEALKGPQHAEGAPPVPAPPQPIVNAVPQVVANQPQVVANQAQPVINPPQPASVSNNNNTVVSSTTATNQIPLPIAVRNGYGVAIPVGPARPPLSDLTFVNPKTSSNNANSDVPAIAPLPVSVAAPKQAPKAFKDGSYTEDFRKQLGKKPPKTKPGVDFETAMAKAQLKFEQGSYTDDWLEARRKKLAKV